MRAQMSEAGGGQKTEQRFPEFAPSLDIITSNRIRRLTAYWESRRQGQALPRRADIDPADIPDLLPNVVMTDIEEPFRVRYRLVGTRVVDFNRLDFTGRYLDDLRWDTSARFTRAYRFVTEHRVPVYSIDAWPLAGEMTGRSEIAILPLSSDGKRVDRCLSMEDFLFSQHQMSPGPMI
jgi:hypothetical protein